ncbi:PaREP1 family protein [Vulcanisaeta souniana]|uniref:PaREP1 family protein n=1 Tax=Vulcanisaeta souniana JCM 11219 TaxID=1293586 RepID=A0A830E4J4_9CREN|nr:PaREP1 family protein [Vulcanisaeta souniana]BDR91788.1 hypothetical protein Vsou_08810 [Vulcanisaeta souniana JCM 11219]GGI70383.1 hypothetical protein GCM10007112_04180 [Vulcanisaeta souniana JCM 11219]
MSQGFNESRKRAELAIVMFNEGLNLISKGDIIQSSEKLYKAVEEAIKALAIAKNLDEAREALEKGRWTVSLLDRAAIKLGDGVRQAWAEAYFLRVNGFHEVRIGIDEGNARIPIIQRLIDYVRREFAI